MNSQVELYKSPAAPLSSHNLCWNLYGPGLDNIGCQQQAESCAIPVPDPDQLLVRVDAVSLCLSDIKLIQQGRDHPRLYHRDLSRQPTRLGHEVSLTVLQVGDNLKSSYQPGQRLALQPDIYRNGLSTAYGYTIPGGLIRFHLVGAEIMSGDAGSYLLPVTPELGYAEVALTEPWACVVAAYTQRRRLAPIPGGVMWLVGYPGDRSAYQFSSGLDRPSQVVASDVSTEVLKLVQSCLAGSGGEVIVRDGLQDSVYQRLKTEFPLGFDDIVMMNPQSAQAVSAASDLLKRRGTLNLVGRQPLDGYPAIDLGRIHYDYIAYLGTTGPDIAAAYGERRNRCELCRGGTAVFVGAGGPMGQMHIQRAIEMPAGPSTILATDLNPTRLEVLKDRFTGLALQHNRRLLFSNSNDESLGEFVWRETSRLGADDCIVCVPSAQVMAQAAVVLNPDGMLVLFAGVPVGTLAPLNLSQVYLHNTQFTGTSGSSLDDQVSIIQATRAGKLAPARSVAAIGGMEAAHDGLRALMEGRFPGKVVIFPQLSGLPLVGLSELNKISPRTAANLASDGSWTRQAEEALIEEFWQP